MAQYDFAAQRLFVTAPLGSGAEISLDRAAANYLLNVLRLRDGSDILVFNGRDGEWRARVAGAGRKTAELRVEELLRPQPEPGRLTYLFAPLKHARLDYMVQKAVEMGAAALKPVFTARTVAGRINRERMRANVIEAAEQCGILAVPELLPEERFEPAVRGLDPESLLVFCDEDAPVASPFEALRGASTEDGCTVVVGPEGGFSEEERALMLARPGTRRVSLGPRILRADTAAVAALAAVQMALGDWR